jgi:hypothetical protein
MANERQITVKLIGDSSSAERSFQVVSKQAQTLSGRFRTVENNLLKTGAVITGVVTGVGLALKGAVDAALESQKISRQTEAIIKATGGAAGLAASEVGKLSEALAFKTGVDDEAIQSSLNLLLTFKQVQNVAGEGNDIFNRASQAVLDLGNVFGSTDSAAVQLGKALSDPIRGVTALRRSGINFTESQQDLIKSLVASGQSLEAQKLILAEVESQVGGTAEATATGFGKMQVAVDNVKERLGAIFLPILERFANFISNSVLPRIDDFIDRFNNLDSGTKGTIAAITIFTVALGPALIAIGLTIKAVRLLGIAFVFLQKRALLIPLAIVAIISILAMQVKSLQVGVQATDNFVIKSLGAFNNMLKGLSDFGNKFARFIEGLINPLIDFYNKTVDVAKGLRSVFGIEVAAADDNLTHLAKVTLPNVTFNIDGVIDATRRGFKSLGDLAFQATELEKEANALATGMDEVATSAEKVGKGSTKAKEESVKLSGAFRTTLQAAQAFARGASELTRELGGDLIASFTSKILMAGKVTKDTVSDFKDLVSEIKDRVSNALSVANQKLDEAVGRFNAYRDSIAEGILQGTGLADIAAKQTEAISAVNAAIEAQTKAQIAVNKAIADGDEDSIAKANEDLKEANDILAEAKRNQRSFLDFLRTGVDQAKAFAGQIDQLRLAGASLEVVQQIAQLGAETGSRVARELLEGGRQAIETANDLVAVVRASAVAAGTAAAETFFGAGVAAARAYIDAIRQTILELQPILDDIARRIAEALRIPMPSTNIGGGGGGGGGQLFTELGRGGVTQAGIEMVRQGQNIPDSVVASYIISDPFGTTLEEYARQLGVTGFAKGAIVRNPMMGLVGEAGPEAIIPLNRANGLGNTYNITVNPGLSTNAETGRAVVEAIKRYERTSGQVFATA